MVLTNLGVFRKHFTDPYIEQHSAVKQRHVYYEDNSYAINQGSPH
jgi:hypothetical protein